ncbi:hypothetical protein SARC_03162 [Sphaeroforma arctica JP610]|uniref:CBF1-interacting co-repressor CIR N-terminal domain-containing protein n=1 Tax=Sphaeroforma arctica JP610 TaxID=667725 RepID=A0A0L0G6K4_9EUKA|nr:hypothetical protein SARC_03162 [Sphaeroforma arctica JP610]KNC84632.1 hypothetical protein SARC_03162 [Sphaeroforma arctica JP610]|eukprot:XP_014158534.1 hypothetical protein SARC_03162 [Sphaeroforma arctica JP610]
MSISKFMNLKSFHPGNFANQKAVWIAQERDKDDKKHQKQLQQVLQKEQQEHKLLETTPHSIEERNRLALSFMYKQPPGLEYAQEKLKLKDREMAKKRKREEEDKRMNAQERYIRDKDMSLTDKFEVLKNAPRTGDYVADVKRTRNIDRPFGVEIRNIKCLKCGNWGHGHTERVCPLFNTSKQTDQGINEDDELVRPSVVDPLELMRDMKNGGLAMKQTILGRLNDDQASNQQMVFSDEDDDGREIDAQTLRAFANLSPKSKRKVLRRMKKSSALGDNGGGVQKKHKKRRKTKKKKSSRS